MTDAQKKRIAELVAAGKLTAREVSLLNVPEDKTLPDHYAQRDRELAWQKVNDPTDAELREERKSNAAKATADAFDGLKSWARRLADLNLAPFSLTFVEPGVLAMQNLPHVAITANLM